MGFHNRETYQADIEPVTAHFAAIDHNTNGGSSYFALTGEKATSGFVVGGSGLPEVEHPNANLSPAQFQANRDRVRASVTGLPAAVQKQAVAGGWHRMGVPGKTDAHVMDKSDVLSNRDAAVSLAKSRGEDAIFHLDNFEEISTR